MLVVGEASGDAHGAQLVKALRDRDPDVKVFGVAGERFAVATSAKFLCVNPFITERLQKTYPRQRDKIDTLWTWVNTDIFQPRTFPAERYTISRCLRGPARRVQEPRADVSDA